MDKTSDVLQKEKYYVYTLLSLKDNKLYTGYTVDLQKRLNDHMRGLSRATRYRRPLLLIHCEYFIERTDAKAREIFLKSGFGRKQLKESLKRTLRSTIIES